MSPTLHVEPRTGPHIVDTETASEVQVPEKRHLKESRSFENCLADSIPTELIQNRIAFMEISNFDKLVDDDEEPFHLTSLITCILLNL